MELVRGAHNLKAGHRPSVATIGNFDGIHRGHRAVIETLQAAGHRLGLPTTVVIFEPQPREFFTPGNAPGRITRLRDKLQVLASLGVDRTLCLRFDARLAAQSAEDFIQDLIVDGIGARFLMWVTISGLGTGAGETTACLRKPLAITVSSYSACPPSVMKVSG